MSAPKPPAPVRATMDGSEAVVWAETRIGHAAFAYPITPSTPMGQGFQQAVAAGKKNLWGEPLVFLELESEHSSASSCEGFALAGGRATNFTSGQGLVLMKEVLHGISGKRLPLVFHIGARALTSQALNIHAGHDDVMAVADCGWGMLFARNAQEALDLALIARRAAEDARTPFMNVQDGFLTTHTLETLHLPDEEVVREYIGPASERLENFFDPGRPLMSGTVQNQDSYMKGRAAQRYFYDDMAVIVKSAMSLYAGLTGRRYGLVDAHRMEDAEFALIGMGSMMETARLAVDWLREKRGIAAGCLNITSFRPFPGPEAAFALYGVKAAAVLERTDNPAAQSNPLTAEVKAALADAVSGAEGYVKINAAPEIFSGAAGLGGRDVRPGDLIAAVQHMAAGRGSGRGRFFYLSIPHELALPRGEDPDLRPQDAFSMRGHSIGGYGSVTTNKVIASLAAEVFGLHVQAYSRYGSEKKGLPTAFFLSAAPEPVRLHCELEQVDCVAVLDPKGFESGDPLRGLQEGGVLFFQSPHAEPRAAWESLPEGARETIRAKKIRAFALDLVGAAKRLAPSADLAVRMQGVVFLGAFLKISPLRERHGLSEAALFEGVERAFGKYFGRRGESALRANMEAARFGYGQVMEIKLPRAAARAGKAAEAQRSALPS